MESASYWQQMLTEYSRFTSQYPALQECFNMLGTIVPMALLLAFPGLLLMAVVGQLQTLRRQRSCYAKAGHQLTVLATLLGTGLSIGGAIWMFHQYSTLTPDDVPVPAQVRAIAWVCTATGTVLAALYLSLWKALKNWPRIHQYLGLSAMLISYSATYCVMAGVTAQGQIDAGIPLATLQDALVPAGHSPLWNALYYLPILVTAMAGGIGSLWLILRRKRDDYGRDHYTAVLPWAARWARNSWLILWLLLLFFTGWDLVLLADARPTIPLRELANYAAKLLLWLIPLLLWAIPAKSPTPMRHKFTLLLAQLLATAFLAPFFAGLTWGY